jgi:hypothetical protein
MEMSQENSLYSYLKQTKMSFFKNREQKGKSGPVWVLVPAGEERKGCKKVNIVKILCTHVCKWKN